MLKKLFLLILFTSVLLLGVHTSLAKKGFHLEENKQTINEYLTLLSFEEKLKTMSQKAKNQLAHDLNDIFLNPLIINVMLRCDIERDSSACRKRDAIQDSLEERLGSKLDLADPYIIALLKANGVEVKYTPEDSEKRLLEYQEKATKL